MCGYRSDGFSFGPMSIGLNLISEFEKIHQKNNYCLNLFFEGEGRRFKFAFIKMITKNSTAKLLVVLCQM